MGGPARKEGRTVLPKFTLVHEGWRPWPTILVSLVCIVFALRSIL